MSTFKVGDRLRVVTDNFGWGNIVIGDEGVVVESDNYLHSCVRFEKPYKDRDAQYWWESDSRYELVPKGLYASQLIGQWAYRIAPAEIRDGMRDGMEDSSCMNVKGFTSAPVEILAVDGEGVLHRDNPKFGRSAPGHFPIEFNDDKWALWTGPVPGLREDSKCDKDNKVAKDSNGFVSKLRSGDLVVVLNCPRYKYSTCELENGNLGTVSRTFCAVDVEVHFNASGRDLIYHYSELALFFWHPGDRVHIIGANRAKCAGGGSTNGVITSDQKTNGLLNIDAGVNVDVGNGRIERVNLSSVVRYDASKDESLKLWSQAKERYTAIQTAAGKLRTSLGGCGSDELNVPKCGFCASDHSPVGKKCSECGWGKKFGVCSSRESEWYNLVKGLDTGFLSNVTALLAKISKQL